MYLSVGSQLVDDLISLVHACMDVVCLYGGSQMAPHLICDYMGEVDECFLDVDNQTEVSLTCQCMSMTFSFDSILVAKCFTI